mgnify:FL=1
MKILFLCFLTCISLVSFSQKRKKKLTLEEQVAIARIQEQEAKKNAQKPLTLEGAKLPKFNVLTSKEQLFFDTSAAPNKPFIIALFNPGCDHCMKTLQDFYKNLHRFKEATILFVTGNNLWGELKNFLDISKVNLDGIHNLIVSADHSDVLKDLFEYNGIPQVMIYNKDKVLQKMYFKDIHMDSVIMYMNK